MPIQVHTLTRWALEWRQEMGIHSQNVAYDHLNQTFRVNRLNKTTQVHGVVMRAFQVELTHTWHFDTSHHYTSQLKKLAKFIARLNIDN